MLKKLNVKNELKSFISSNKVSDKLTKHKYSVKKKPAKQSAEFMNEVKNYQPNRKQVPRSIIQPPKVSKDTEDNKDNVKPHHKPMLSKMGVKTSHNKPPRLFNKSLHIQLRFANKRHLISMLAEDKKEAYFDACLRVIDLACQALLTLPDRQSVRVINTPTFEDTGTQIELQAREDYQLAESAIILAMLLKISNQILHESLREKKMFSLEMVFGVHESERHPHMQSLLMNTAQPSEILVLLPEEMLDRLYDLANYNEIATPSNPFENECLFVDNPIDDTLDLVNVLSSQIFEQM